MAQINELQAAIASNSAGPLENEDVQKLAVENIKLKHRLSILDNVSFVFVCFVIIFVVKLILFRHMLHNVSI